MNPSPGRLRKATGVVPSLFTVGNMALGFFAIMAAMDRRWVAGTTAIFVAHIMDILDGRVARWMGLESKFGGEFDSFADWISFGIAPGILMYELTLKNYGKLGFLLTFFFILCGALRLARFNLKSADATPDQGPSLNFTGLPIPGAGGFVAVVVLLCGLGQAGNPGRTYPLLYEQVPRLFAAAPVIVFTMALLMISKVQYSTFKRTHFFRPQSLRTFLITLFVIFMIYAYPQNTIFILYVGYIMWGVIGTAWRAYRLRRRDTI